MTHTHPPSDTKIGHLLIHFPCEFVIKVIGVHNANFVDAVVGAIQTVLPHFKQQDITTRRHGKYLSLTCTLWVHSQVELDAVYSTLSAHPAVKFVL